MAIVIIIQTLLFAALAFVAVALDDMSAVSLNVAFVLIFAAPALIVVALLRFRNRPRRSLIVPLIYLAFICILPLVPHTPVKPAVRAVRAIQPGMTEAEVRTVLDEHFPIDGRFTRPDYGPVVGNLLAFPLDENDGRYNAACIWIEFADGRCTKAEFLAD